MEVSQIINLCAMIFSPMLSVWTSIYIQERRELKNRKFSLFLTLIATRHNVTTEEQVRSFNSVDILFYSNPEVRKNWRKFLALHHQVGHQAEWEVKKIELLKSIAHVLGYKNSTFR